MREAKTKEIPFLSESDKKRFWEKVAKDTGSECWLWSGAKDDDGYGYFNLSGETYKAHRVSWKLFYGSISSRKCVLHKCDNPPCVRIIHLFTGTLKDNSEDMCKKGRHGPIPEKTPRGEKHWKSKLTKRKIIEIRERCSKGENQRKISEDLGISYAQVSKIKNKKSWSHV